METSVLGGINMKDPNRQRKIKRIRVSKQRQISIPKEFYDSLGLGDEVDVEFTGNSIILRPVKSSEIDFSEIILADLIKEGYSGEELLKEFTRIKKQLPDALERYVKDEANIHEVDDLDEYLDQIGE